MISDQCLNSNMNLKYLDRWPLQTVFIAHGKNRFSHFMVVGMCGDELMSIEVLTCTLLHTLKPA